MKLDSAQLHAFATVLREGSFDAAARVLNLSAPAVSQRIKQLEERLGQVLIHRGPPCRATDAGESLARHAQQIALLEAETLRALGHAMQAPHEPGAPGRSGAIRLPVAINADSLESWFMDVIDTLAETDIYLDIRVDDQDHTARMLREGSVVAAMSAEPLPVQGCHVKALGAMPYQAVASPEFVARYFAAAVTADDMQRALNQAPMLQFNGKDALQSRFIEQTLSRLKNREVKQETVMTGNPPLTPPPTHFLPSSTGFVEAARRGLAWGMIPERMAKPCMQSGELVPICAAAQLDVPLYWQQWALASPTLTLVADTVTSLAVQNLISIPC